MTLRRLFTIAFSAMVIGLLGLSVMSGLMIANQEAMNRWHDLRYRSSLLADELRQSSDDLTRLARLFVVTGDPSYESSYNEVLAIRNGQSPRPQDYHRVYWDLVLDRSQRPRPSGEPAALQDLMARAGFSAREFGLMRQAQENSDALVRTETVAMNAVKGLDPEGGSLTPSADESMPIRIMHDAHYMKNKAEIMVPIDLFLQSVESRTRQEVESRTARGRALLIANQIIVGAVLTLAISFGILVPATIFRQIGGEPRTVEEAVRRIADGDLTAAPGSGETRKRGIARAMADMTTRLRLVVSDVEESARQIALRSTTVNNNAVHLAQASQEQAQATHEATTSMTQIVGTIRNTASHASQTGDLARLAAEDARTSGHAVVQTVGSMHEIAERVGVIGEFARRTRILSLNAAIEAARAQTGGKGFSVVASEVRALAERSEAAAGEIDQLVTSSLKVAERARVLIDRLVPTIERTTQLIQEIGEASAEQSRGAGQIQIALEQIESVARKDSEASSNLLDLANDLAHQSRTLESAMGFFHLRNPRDRGPTT